jgi:hypothetical protein
VNSENPYHRRPTRALRAGAVLLPLFWALGMAPTALAQREAKVFAITDWGSECSGGDRKYWDDFADRWYNEMSSHGVFFKDGRFINGEMSLERFCDPNGPQGALCQDSNFLDDADAAFIGTHGSDLDGAWGGLLRVKNGFNQCFINAPQGGNGDDMFVGDTDLEFLHLSSCNSLDDDNINNAWRMFQDPGAGSGANRLHQVTGFHGVMWVSWSYRGDYEDFADDAHDVSIQHAWTDNMYHYRYVGSSQCPVALSVGANESDARNRLLTERYDNVLSNPSSSNTWAYAFYEGCNPQGDGPFDDPND